jgi:hypothetical protein
MFNEYLLQIKKANTFKWQIINVNLTYITNYIR